MSSQFGAPQTFRQIRDAAASANVLGEKVTVEAAKALAESFGEATYDYATQTWHWDASTYRVLHLTDDGGDPYELIFSRMLPDDRDRIAAELQAAIDNAVGLAGQYRFRDDDGHIRSISFIGDVEKDTDGNPVTLRGLAFDVTEQVRLAATEAVQSATRSRAAIEQVKGALMLSYGLDDAASFAILARYSQASNLKLATIAQRVVEQMSQKRDSSVTLLQMLDAAVVVS